MDRMEKILDWFIKHSSYLFPVALLLIAFLSHVFWFLPGNRLFAFDTPWLPEDFIQGFRNGGNHTFAGYLDFGYPEIQIYFNLFYFLWSIVGVDMGQQIFLMIPIAVLSVLSPYYLLRHLVGSPVIASIGALFFSFATPLLMRENAHLFIAFIFAFTPLLLLLFIRFSEKPSFARAIVFGTLYALGLAYEVRVMLLVSVILALHFLIVLEKKKWVSFIRYLSVSIIVTILLSLYWILPTLHFGGEYIGTVTQRPVFGTPFFSLTYAWSLFHPWWDLHNGLEPFTFKSIPFLQALVPLFIFSPILLFSWWYTPVARRRYVLFFLLLAVTGIFFSKQNNAPLAGLYEILYEYIPGFNLYRTGEQFYIFTMLGYTGLFGYIGQWLLRRYSQFKDLGKISVIVVLSVFALIPIMNAMPLFRHDASGLFYPNTMPSVYEHYNSYIKKQPGFVRTFWIPWEDLWSYFSFEKPKARLNGSVFGRQEFGLFDQEHPGLQILYTKPEAEIQSLLNLASIRNIVVLPNQDLFWFDGRWFAKYHIRTLRTYSFLQEQQIMRNQPFAIFNNPSAAQLVYLTEHNPIHTVTTTIFSVDHTKYLPTRVDVHIRGLSKTRYLNISYTPLPDWRARVGNFQWIDAIWKPAIELVKEPSMPFLNTWVVDPEKLKAMRTAGVRVNEDGSVDADITIYFRPEAHFSVGSILSFGTTIILLLYGAGFCVWRAWKYLVKSLFDNHS